MSYKLKLGNPEYKVFRNAGIVLCTFKCRVSGNNPESKETGLFKPFRACAKAQCSSKDTFNVETGKRIAQTRAKYEAYKKASKMIFPNQREELNLISNINKAMELVEFSRFLRFLKTREREHLEKLIN